MESWKIAYKWVRQKGQHEEQEEGGHLGSYKWSTRFYFCERDRRQKKDGEQSSGDSFCLQQVGKVSHRVRQGLGTNNVDGRTWEHQKQGWPVYIGG